MPVESRMESTRCGFTFATDGYDVVRGACSANRQNNGVADVSLI